MEFKGKIVDINTSFLSNTTKITLEYDGSPAEAEELVDKDLRCTLKRWRERRSLDANAYFWVLLDKLAVKLGKSKTELYRAYIKDVGGNSITICVQNKAVESLVKGWEHNGLGWQTDTMESQIPKCTNVILYFGSSTYDTEQMSRLIDLVVQDCKDQGISTLTPEELEQLKGSWHYE